MVTTWLIRPQIRGFRLVPPCEDQRFCTGRRFIRTSFLRLSATSAGLTWTLRRRGLWVHESFGPSRELARRLERTVVIVRQQSHTARQHSYGTGGFFHDLDYLPLEIPTGSQRVCRVQVVIHLIQCVFETRRSESRPASAWYLGQTGFFNLYPPNSSLRGGRLLFFSGG